MIRFVSSELSDMAKWFLVFFSVAVLSALIYLPALEVPWYFDDFPNIVNNGRVSDLGVAWEKIFTPRGLSYFTFALNYHFSELDTFLFHMVNIAIHAACSLTVFALLRNVYKGCFGYPFFGALLFLCHPLQTQAVTYIVQRMASQCALFLLLSVLFFQSALRWYGNKSSAGPMFWWRILPSFIAGCLALLSKENAAVLPLIFLLWLSFDVGENGLSPRQRLKVAAPPLVLVFVAGVVLCLSGFAVVDALKSPVEFFVGANGGELVDVVLGSDVDGLRLKYLMTQSVVFWIYVKLFLFPFGQVFDYSYPLVNSFYDYRFIIGVAGLFSAFFLAAYLGGRYKRICFGFWWIIIALSVESSIIPLDPVFEHRLYLPMFGFVVICVEVLRTIRPKYRSTVAVIVIAVLSVLTFNRNTIWANPVAMWEDNLSKVPHSYRVHLSLGKAYVDSGEELKSIKVLQEVFRKEPSNALKNSTTYYENFIELGKSYYRMEMVDDAISHFERGVVLYPDSAAMYTFLAALYLELGWGTEAREAIMTAYALNPKDPQVVVQYRQIMGR